MKWHRQDVVGKYFLLKEELQKLLVNVILKYIILDIT